MSEAKRATGFPKSGAGTTGAAQSELAITTQRVGDLLILAGRINEPGASVGVSAVSGGGVTTWTKIRAFTDTTDKRYVYLWVGVVTATGAQTVKLTFSGTIGTSSVEIVVDELEPPSDIESFIVQTSAQEEHPTANSNAPTCPSITPSAPAAGSMALVYWGYCRASNTQTSGSTPGFTYFQTTEKNQVMYATSVTSGEAHQPSSVATSVSFDSLALILEGKPGPPGSEEPPVIEPEAGEAPVVTKPANQESNKGKPIPTLTLSATNSPTSWTLTAVGGGANPVTGLSINASGEITGTPTPAAGTYTVEVKATNAFGTSAGVTFTWKINLVLALEKPAEQSSTSGVAITPFQIGVVKSGTGVAPYTYSIESGFPPGITVTSAGVAEGTPTGGAHEYTTAKLKVEDAEGVTDKVTFTWKVSETAPVAPVVTNPGRQVSRRGVAVSLTISATGQEAGGFSAEHLPAGLSMSSEGVISGTPSSVEETIVTVKVKGPGGTTSVSFEWAIVEPEVASASRATLRYYAYDFLTGLFLGELPIRSVNFTKTLDSIGQLTGSVDLNDPRLRAANVLGATVPNRSVIVVDWGGLPVWAGVSLPRKWDVDSSGSGTTGILSLSYSSIWAYFQQRIQATDYSSPPFSGITGSRPMDLWPETPWFAPLIACQVMKDALSVPYGNPLGGTTVTLNGATPVPSFGDEVAEADRVAVNYPYPSLATVESIVSQLSQLGLGVGFDFAYEVAYEEGKPEGKLEGRFEVDWPWRGAPEDRDDRRPLWRIDLVRARKYSFPEDGSQAAWQVYEVGGGGAIYVDSNVNPPAQGYPLLERVISRSNIQSPKIMALLGLMGVADLAIYSYAPTTPTITLGLEDPMLPLGEFEVGDLMQLVLPKGFDPRFPAGLEQTWRLTSYTVDAKDEGDATMSLTFAQPVLDLAEVDSTALI